MSRTDIHRPYMVLLVDPTIRHWFVDHHDHLNGVCDLDDYLNQVPGWTFQTGCYRGTTAACPNLCGCVLCTGRMGRKYARRQERAQWRVIRNDLLKVMPEDREDMDVPLIRGEEWW